MAESSKTGRKRGELPIEPISFLAISEHFKERISEKEPQLRAAGLWEFITELEIPWLWPADLAEFVISAETTKFRDIRVQGHQVRFDVEAISLVTTLPDTDNVAVTEACRAIDAPEWGVAFEDGQSAFDVRKQGWNLLKALPPWRDWLLLIQQRIELRSDGDVMEHCVVCAALAAWIRGTKFNWADEVRLRIKEEVEKGKYLRPIPMRSAGYIGSLCQLSFGSDTPRGLRRSVTPFLSKPSGFERVEPVSREYSPPQSPEPPVILEEYIELNREDPRGVEGFCLP